MYNLKVMKKLKLDHTLAELVLKGEKTTTWRLFDDKDLSVNDQLLLIDKINPKDPKTWKTIGTATIDKIVQKRLGDITEADMEGQERFASKEEVLTTFQRYYGSDVTWHTPVKMVHFNFSAEIPSTRATEILSKVEKVVLYADGGSRGNPGPSASGYVIYDEHKSMLVHRGIYLGITTNNQAEYTALKLALEEARSLGAREVEVYMDSLLVINQMKGIFKVKNRDLWPIHDAIKQLCGQFKRVTFTQVPRELNKLADAAVNKALDEELNITRPSS
jgi:ribonuclease HI